MPHDMPQVNLVAAVGIGGAIGPADALPKFIDEEEAEFFQRWFFDLTEGGIIVLGHDSLRLMRKIGFRGMAEGWSMSCWTRSHGLTPDAYMDALQKTGKPIFIAGGHETFRTFMPYVKQFFIRRVELAPPHDNYLPPLFGRTQ